VDQSVRDVPVGAWPPGLTRVPCTLRLARQDPISCGAARRAV